MRLRELRRLRNRQKDGHCWQKSSQDSLLRPPLILTVRQTEYVGKRFIPVLLPGVSGPFGGGFLHIRICICQHLSSNHDLLVSICDVCLPTGSARKFARLINQKPIPIPQGLGSQHWWHSALSSNCTCLQLRARINF